MDLHYKNIKAEGNGLFSIKMFDINNVEEKIFFENTTPQLLIEGATIATKNFLILKAKNQKLLEEKQKVENINKSLVENGFECKIIANEDFSTYELINGPQELDFSFRKGNKYIQARVPDSISGTIVSYFILNASSEEITIEKIVNTIADLMRNIVMRPYGEKKKFIHHKGDVHWGIDSLDIVKSKEKEENKEEAISLQEAKEFYDEFKNQQFSLTDLGLKISRRNNCFAGKKYKILSIFEKQDEIKISDDIFRLKEGISFFEIKEFIEWALENKYIY